MCTDEVLTCVCWALQQAHHPKVLLRDRIRTSDAPSSATPVAVRPRRMPAHAAAAAAREARDREREQSRRDNNLASLNAAHNTYAAGGGGGGGGEEEAAATLDDGVALSSQPERVTHMSPRVASRYVESPITAVAAHNNNVRTSQNVPPESATVGRQHVSEATERPDHPEPGVPEASTSLGASTAATPAPTDTQASSALPSAQPEQQPNPSVVVAAAAAERGAPCNVHALQEQRAQQRRSSLDAKSEPVVVSAEVVSAASHEAEEALAQQEAAAAEALAMDMDTGSSTLAPTTYERARALETSTSATTVAHEPELQPVDAKPCSEEPAAADEEIAGEVAAVVDVHPDEVEPPVDESRSRDDDSDDADADADGDGVVLATEEVEAAEAAASSEATEKQVEGEAASSSAAGPTDDPSPSVVESPTSDGNAARDTELAATDGAVASAMAAEAEAVREQEAALTAASSRGLSADVQTVKAARAPGATLLTEEQADDDEEQGYDDDHHSAEGEEGEQPLTETTPNEYDMDGMRGLDRDTPETVVQSSAAAPAAYALPQDDPLLDPIAVGSTQAELSRHGDDDNRADGAPPSSSADENALPDDALRDSVIVGASEKEEEEAQTQVGTGDKQQTVLRIGQPGLGPGLGHKVMVLALTRFAPFPGAGWGEGGGGGADGRVSPAVHSAERAYGRQRHTAVEKTQVDECSYTLKGLWYTAFRI